MEVVRSDALAFLKGLPAESVDLVCTDPPYSGMNQHLQLGKGRIVGSYKERGKGGKWFEEFADTPENYHALLSELNRVMKNDRHIYIMFDGFSLLSLGPLVRDHFAVKNVITWDKINIGMGHYFRRQSEFIVFACKGKRALSTRKVSDVFKVKRLHNAAYPTQKPRALFELMMAVSTHPLDPKPFVVCDPFSGAGTVAMAALRGGLDFVGCDVSSEAVELANRRLRHFEKTGEDLLEPAGEAASLNNGKTLSY